MMYSGLSASGSAIYEAATLALLSMLSTDARKIRQSIGQPAAPAKQASAPARIRELKKFAEPNEVSYEDFVRDNVEGVGMDDEYPSLMTA